MSSEPTTVPVPAEVFQQIETLQGHVQSLQRELSQALEVWETTLSAEKNHFDELLRHKEMAWQEQEERWARQAQAYEARLDDVKAEYEDRLRQLEQKAVRELSDLDEAWQHEKLEWGPVARDAWPAQRRVLEAKVASLEHAISELEKARAPEVPEPLPMAEPPASEAPVAVPSAAESHEAPRIVRSGDPVEGLQSQSEQFNERLAALQQAPQPSTEQVTACLDTLEQEIELLHGFVQQASRPVPAGEPTDVVEP